ncbi:putative porin [Robertkochia sediminum]|uniref:putative porin n=1 Tax=Robertkochia sediminum TaxID=2785326 RepID=UPI00193317E1|nr:putative porin [Robertkochia sediminum]MBL7472868.1 putative porin [Robertkochia sediminum]
MRPVYLLLLFFIGGVTVINAQVKLSGRPRVQQDTAIALGEKKGDKKKTKDLIAAEIEAYKIISIGRDTTVFDTTLTIQKEYRHNYLRRDDFELLPFSNVGHPYNILGAPLSGRGLYPELGASAKSNGYLEVEDINYYHVPTPTTEIFFKTVMEQGQTMDALFTLNTSERFNVFIGYKGMRSLGKYRHYLASNGNFQTGFSYSGKNGRYRARVHMTSQDVLNQENGGLLVPEQFTSGDTEFTDRGRVDLLFENAENKLVGKRYFLDHDYLLIRPQDSVSDRGVRIGHTFNYETKNYTFIQDRPEDYFGDAFTTDDISDLAKLRVMRNNLRLGWESKALGDITAEVGWYNYNYFFNSVVITPDGVIDNQLQGNEVAVGGQWAKAWGPLSLKARVMQNISGDLGGNLLDASMELSLTDDLTLEAALHRSSRMADFNYLLYQSDYREYNWQNSDTFDKESYNTISVALNSEKWGRLEASYSLIDNKAYFATNPTDSLNVLNPEEQMVVKPYQFDETISYLKVKFENEFRVGHFGLYNTVMYQNVQQDQPVMNVPDLVTRNTLYYENHLFKKALYLQTGITLKYFTSFYLNGYNPVLGELYSQGEEEIGDFPMLDFFINAKVRRTRFYLKAEHFNSSFTGYNFYSAPNYPYRDFVIRFGFVWNFFT